MGDGLSRGVVLAFPSYLDQPSVTAAGILAKLGLAMIALNLSRVDSHMGWTLQQGREAPST